jgi:hypothetical protein
MRSTQAAHRKIVNEELHGPKSDTKCTSSREARQAPDALQIARHDHVMSISDATKQITQKKKKKQITREQMRGKISGSTTGET